MNRHSRGNEGYLCEVYALPLNTSPMVVLSTHRTNSPRLAMRWLRTQALRLARALDPVPDAGPFPSAALRPVPEEAVAAAGPRIRQWAQDRTAYETHLRELRTGRLTSLVATDDQALYALTARPIPPRGTTAPRFGEATGAAESIPAASGHAL